MSRTPSLRARIVLGAIAWTLGLLVVVSAALSMAIDRHRGAAVVVHGVLAHTSGVVVLAAILLAVGLWSVGRGLGSLSTLRARLRDVQQGEAQGVTGVYPAEVQPLVDDLNALLVQRDAAVRRAQARAGDLAHGLKTPLAILAQEARQLSLDGQSERAASLDEQVARMRRQIDYQLAHARAAAAGAAGRLTARTAVAPVVSTLVRTLARLHAERRVTVDVDVPGHLHVRCSREDLDEMIGNVMDNACTWARSRVRVRAASEAGVVTLHIEDDGRGLSLVEAEEALRRGRRLDEAVPGSGLGLAITRDLAELYEGTLSLARSSLGGVDAQLRLPAAPGGG